MLYVALSIFSFLGQVKNLLTVDYRDAVPVRKMIIRKIPRYSNLHMLPG